MRRFQRIGSLTGPTMIMLSLVLGWVICASATAGSFALAPRIRPPVALGPEIVPTTLLSDALQTELNGMTSEWAHLPELLAVASEAVLCAEDSGTRLPAEPAQVMDAMNRTPSLQPTVRYVILRYTKSAIACTVRGVCRDITELALVGHVDDAHPELFIRTVSGQWYQIKTSATMVRLIEYGNLVRQWELDHSDD